ncbi:hypothetical protein RRG08_059407 [Elysia crispata]|uniref:Uncharacterized protein n=1 Tax=Elysia crispata TaxID=231223 RepID=A0AAE1DVZ0_9GAST|nr:hypothetical protein RRG08_059407 [Elysia crispata]
MLPSARQLSSIIRQQDLQFPRNNFRPRQTVHIYIVDPAKQTYSQTHYGLPPADKWYGRALPSPTKRALKARTATT